MSNLHVCRLAVVAMGGLLAGCPARPRAEMGSFGPQAGGASAHDNVVLVALPAQEDAAATVIAPLSCRNGVGQACLSELRSGQTVYAADGRAVRLGRPARDWACGGDTSQYHEVFTSTVSLSTDVRDELLATDARSVLVGQRNGELAVDLDGDGVNERVVQGRDVITIEDGRTGAATRVKSVLGLGLMRLVGAAEFARDSRVTVVFREGREYRAVGADGVPFELGFGCLGI